MKKIKSQIMSIRRNRVKKKEQKKTYLLALGDFSVEFTILTVCPKRGIQQLEVIKLYKRHLSSQLDVSITAFQSIPHVKSHPLSS